MYDVIIIGCGVVGAATAYQLSRYQLNVAVLEAGNDVADGTTKANSAIIHAGYDPEPGTLMAKLNVEGSRMAAEICKKLQVPYAQIGSLVLAFDEEDMHTVQTIYLRGKANGVPELSILDGQQTRALEPNLSEAVKGALYAPTAGIVNPWEFALAMAEVAVKNGVELFLESPVTAIRSVEDGYEVCSGERVWKSRYVVNAAGIFADQVHGLLEEPDFCIKPARGEYYLLDKSQGQQVSRVIFQCPNQNGKGVLVSPTIHGNLIVGPNAESVMDRFDLGTTRAGLDFVRERALCSVPGLNLRENIRNFAGLRANSNQSDFIIRESPTSPGFFDLAGIKSPGLSSAPAIGCYLAELLDKAGCALREKAHFDDSRTHVLFKELPDEEKSALIRRDPSYGRVICRCETITEGDILASLRTPIPPRTINGVKRRCNAGMGRCQGGFCSPRVHEILARELGVPPEEILMDQPGTYLITGETKEVMSHV